MDLNIKGKVWEQLSFTSLFDLEFKPEFDLGLGDWGFFHIKIFFCWEKSIKTVKLALCRFFCCCSATEVLC